MHITPTVERLMRIAVFMCMNGCAGYAAWRAAAVLGRRGRSLSERILSSFTIYFAFVVCVCAVAGFSGAVWLVYAAPLGAFAVSLFVFAPRDEAAGLPALPAPAVAMCGLAAAGLMFMFLWSAVTPPPPGGDGFIYHLYFPAKWIMQGRISYVDLPYGAQAATYYPLNTELYFYWLMQPLREDFLTNCAQLAALCAAALVVYRLSLKLGAGRGGAVVGACTAALLPGFVQQAGVARVDIFFSLWFLLTVYYMLRWRETGGVEYAALAGVAWGLFLGTKSLAVAYSVCLVIGFAAAAPPNGARGAVRAGALMSALMLACGGFWYVRNFAATGNPLYPLELGVGRAVLFGGAYGRGAMKTFHAAGGSELLRIGNLFLGRGPAVYLALCGAACAAMFALRRGFARDRRNAYTVFALLLPLLVAVLFWKANPHNNLTNGRFLFPAFLAACVYPALVIGRCDGLGGRFVAAAAPAAMIAGMMQPGCDHLRRMAVDISAAVSGGGSFLLSPAAAPLRVFAVAVLLLGVFAGFVFVTPERWRFVKAGRAVSGAGFAVALFAGVYLTWNYNDVYRYVWLRATAGVAGDGWYQFIRNVPGGSGVANVGNERAYPLFGPGLRNRVYMVNVDGNREWRFHDYEIAARGAGVKYSGAGGERPQAHRAGADLGAWVDNLAAEGVRYLFCTNLEPIALGHMEHTEDGFPVEVQWMRENPRVFRKIYEKRVAPGSVEGDTYAVEVYSFIPALAKPEMSR